MQNLHSKTRNDCFDQFAGQNISIELHVAPDLTKSQEIDTFKLNAEFGNIFVSPAGLWIPTNISEHQIKEEMV